ncbi:MAG: VCBS repeat-containing protein, partial [Bdellovibrionales bacterium]|nr:VCBS repeat-containing protein [Bdellovibrionales bacterium]
PMVADLDGDGIPEVVFTSFSIDPSDWFSDTNSASPSYVRNGVLRIVNGKTGENIHSISGEEISPYASTSPLLVDLDNDGKIEIIYSHYLGQKVIALNFDGSFRWKYETSRSVANIDSLSASDLNKDGVADILLGNEIISEGPGRLPVRIQSLDTSSASVYQFAYTLDPTKPFEKSIIGRNGAFNSIGQKLFDLPSSALLAVADLDPSRPGLEIVATGN